MVKIMTGCQTGDKSSSQPMIIQFYDTYMRHGGEMKKYVNDKLHYDQGQFSYNCIYNTLLEARQNTLQFSVRWNFPYNISLLLLLLLL